MTTTNFIVMTYARMKVYVAFFFVIFYISTENRNVFNDMKEG